MSTADRRRRPTREPAPSEVMAWLRGETPNHRDVDFPAMATPLPDDDCPRCGHRGSLTAIVRAAGDGLGGAIRCGHCGHNVWYLVRGTAAAEPAMPEDFL